MAARRPTAIAAAVAFLASLLALVAVPTPPPSSATPDSSYAPVWQQLSLFGSGWNGAALTSTGDIYVADPQADKVFFVTAGGGSVTDYAGTGIAGDAGDGNVATNAQLSDPGGLALLPDGDLLVVDTGNDRVRRIDSATQVITAFAGTGTAGFSGDGGPAASALLDQPTGIDSDAAGNVYVADRGNARVRRVDAATGVITTVAGNGSNSDLGAGDDGPATATGIGYLWDVALDDAGDTMYTIDPLFRAIRRVELGTGVIDTVVGNGGDGPGPYNWPARDMAIGGIDSVRSLNVDPTGAVYFKDARWDPERDEVTSAASISDIGPNGDAVLASTALTYYSKPYPGRPRVTAQPIVNVPLGGTSGPIPLAVELGDGEPSEIQVSATSRDAVLLPASTLTVSGSGTSWTLEIDAAGLSEGVTSVKVVASNGPEWTGNAGTEISSPLQHQWDITVVLGDASPSFVPGGTTRLYDVAGIVGQSGLHGTNAELQPDPLGAGVLFLSAAGDVRLVDTSDGSMTVLGSVPESSGVLGTAPDGDALTGGASGVHRLDRDTGTVTTFSVGGTASGTPVVTSDGDLYVAVDGTGMVRRDAGSGVVAPFSTSCTGIHAALPDDRLLGNGCTAHPDTGASTPYAVSMTDPSLGADGSIVSHEDRWDPSTARVSQVWGFTVHYVDYWRQPSGVAEGLQPYQQGGCTGTPEGHCHWPDFADSTIAPDGRLVGIASQRVAAPGQAGVETSEYFLAIVDPPVPASPVTVEGPGAQVVGVDEVVGPLPVTVGGGSGTAGDLVLSGSSSDQAVVPDGNIAFGGSGADRTVTVTPAAGVSGIADITIVVTDPVSGLSAEHVFRVTFAPPPEGTVLTSGGLPIPGIVVTAYPPSQGSPMVAQTISAADGSYELDVPAGDYWLRATDPSLDWLLEWYYESPTSSGATVVSTDGSGLGVPFVLDAAAQMSGVVADDTTGTPIGNAEVRIYQATGGFVKGATTAGDGSWLVEGLAPGDYLVRTTAAGYQTEWWQDAPTTATASAFTLGGGMTIDLSSPSSRIRLVPDGYVAGATVEGLVLDSGTLDPISGATVYLYFASGGLHRTTTTAPDGTYAFEGVDPDSYLLRFGKTGYATEWHNSARRAFSAEPLVVYDGITISLDTPVARTELNPDVVSLSGTITDQDTGLPIAGAKAYLYTVGGYLEVATADGSGYWEMRGLDPATYYVMSNYTGYQHEWFDEAGPDWNNCTGLNDPSCVPVLYLATEIPYAGGTTGGIDATLTPAP